LATTGRHQTSEGETTPVLKATRRKKASQPTETAKKKEEARSFQAMIDGSSGIAIGP